MNTATKIVVLIVLLAAVALPVGLYARGVLVLWKAGLLAFFMFAFLGGIMLYQRYGNNRRALATIDVVLGGGMVLFYTMAALIDGLDYISLLVIGTGIAVLLSGLNQLRKMRNVEVNASAAPSNRQTAWAQSHQP